MDTPQVSWGYSESKFLVRWVDLLVCSAYFNMSATEDNKNLLMTSLTKGNDVLHQFLTSLTFVGVSSEH